MSTQALDFPVSDSIAGYVTTPRDGGRFAVRTADGREIDVELAAAVSAQRLRNLGEPVQDCTADLDSMLIESRFLFCHGIFYPVGDGMARFSATTVILPETEPGGFVFEDARWWSAQAAEIAEFYLRGEFPDGVPDWTRYRTRLTAAGTKTVDHTTADHRQETDTISRLVYGLSTAYLLTGREHFLDAAESGVEYLRSAMRLRDEQDGTVLWQHGRDVSAQGSRPVLASEFGDDYDAIPLYEQIYALAGPVQTYRITGDPAVLADLDGTLAVFERHFRDQAGGGFFSHVDPATLDPRSPRLGGNRARKNWNSVGDHAPAYLINAYLATGRADLRELIVETADTITARFPDDEHSPFVQERFHEDWSADRTWGWQQDRAVVGHNLKIAWNLTRIGALHDDPGYRALAEKIAATMPEVGSDLRRGGWYDVVERTADPVTDRHRFVWHDRKAWWQQEQAILAYLVLAGVGGAPEHLRLARESAAFYNAFFLDHDGGGVHFTVLADGLPYGVGTELLKGSHSMGGYHAMELCYLAAVYTALLVTGRPLELHFRPRPDGFPDGGLRVAPDLLPAGRIRLTDVWIDDARWPDFDAEAMTVSLPVRTRLVRVRVRLAPTDLAFDVIGENGTAGPRIVCRGRWTADAAELVRTTLDELISADDRCDREGRTVELNLAEVTQLDGAAIRELILLRHRLGLRTRLTVHGGPNDLPPSLRDQDCVPVPDRGPLP